MGISGSKSKLRKGGARPQGWYKITNPKWEESTSQKTGEDYFYFVFDGEKPDGESQEVRLLLGKSSKVGDYVRIEDGTLVTVDEDGDYELPENSSVGKFFGSMSEHGVSDKVMDQVGDNPSALEGVVVLIAQEPVLDGDGNVKKNDAGYDITDTVVTKVGTAKDLKGAGASAKGGSAKAAARKVKEVEPEEDDEEEEEEDDDDDDDDEPEPAPKKRGAAASKRR